MREGRKEVRAENWYFQEDERIQKIMHEDRYQQSFAGGCEGTYRAKEK